MKDGADPDTLAAALKVFESQVGYDNQSMEILESSPNLDQFGPSCRVALPGWRFSWKNPDPDRDLDRAAMLYQQVITQWPLSSLERPVRGASSLAQTALFPCTITF